MYRYEIVSDSTANGRAYVPCIGKENLLLYTYLYIGQEYHQKKESKKRY